MSEQEDKDTLLTVSTHLMAGFIAVGLKAQHSFDEMAQDAVTAAKALLNEVVNCE